MADAMVTLECAYCGVSFQRLKYWWKDSVRRGQRPYCSRSHTKLGNPSVNAETIAPFEERFWSKVDRTGKCWTWTGATDQVGYGKLSRRSDGRLVTLSAHRVSWEMANDGPVPDGLWVLHRCDNPPCVRPDHLWLGTPADNTADMIAKGRNRRSVA